MLASLSSQTSASSNTLPSGATAKAATSAPATTPETPSAPGVITQISPAARAAAAMEPSNPPPTSSSPNALLDVMGEAKAGAMEIGKEAMTTLRPALETTAEIALDITYLTELVLGHTMGTTKYFTKAEYIEKYDIGAVLGYVRDYVRETAEAEEAAAAGPQGVNTVAQETWNKMERWVERLRGPKVEVLEYVAVGAAVGYALARIPLARRG
jgi:hypothetical protein